jgi:hypothetical protein
MSDNKYKFRKKRFWISLIVFLLISIIGGLFLEAAREGLSGGFIVLIMLIYALFAAFTDRGWKIYIRILWVIGIWIMQAILLIPVIFTAGYLLALFGLANLGTPILAALPFVIWAMYRSKFFTELVKK